jgi:hypothetical protein
MPQAAVAALAKVFITVGVNALIAKFVATVFVYAATTFLLNKAAKHFGPKMRPEGAVPGASVNYFDTGAPGRIVYGRVMTGGMETIPAIVSGANNRLLHKVITLAIHEIDSYNYTKFNTTTITNAQIGPMAWTSSDGRVIGGAFSGYAYVRNYRGTQTDSVDKILWDVSSMFFGNFRGRGIAKSAVTFDFQRDVYKSVPDVMLVYQGKRCYDPRLDVTPGASPTNASYIAWTVNPVLCLVDYLMANYGGSYESGDIDWDTVVSSANTNEGSTTIPTGTQALYTCNGVLLANAKFEDNVRTLADSMLGRVLYSDGKWRMYSGAWKTPTFSIEKGDWTGGLSVKFEQGKQKRFNRMRCWFVDPTREWQRVECYPRSSSTYLTADKGIRADAETDQLLCTSEFEAQRKAEYLLRQSRNQILVSGRLPPRFQDISLWDTGVINFDDFGWTSKTFRCVSMDLNPDGSCDCVFAEEQSTDWSATITYDSVSHDPVPTTNATTPSEPLNFTAVRQINGTILFDWEEPIVNPDRTYFQILRYQSSLLTTSLAMPSTYIWQGNGHPVPLVQPSSQHWYWVRAAAPAYPVHAVSSFSSVNGVRAVAARQADETRQNRLCGDAEFEFGAVQSLWHTCTAQVQAFAGFALNQADYQPWAMDEVNSTGIMASSYHETGGQYGGYISLLRSNITSNFGQTNVVLLASNPEHPLGRAFNGNATGIEYQARMRIHSLNWTPLDQFEFGTLVSYSTPNSPDIRAWTATHRVSSVAALRLGEWVTINGFGVVMPPIRQISPGSSTPQAVESAFGFYMRPGIRINPAANTVTMNMDVDFFQATDVGYRNDPVRSSFFTVKDSATHQPGVAGTLYDFMGMINLVLTGGNGSGSILFPDSATYGYTDWRHWNVGRSLRVVKPNPILRAFINPSSGMTLRLAGRAAAGTVTFNGSFTAFATIEKTDDAEFTVSGQGLL